MYVEYMIYSYHVILGLAAIFIGLIGYLPYYRDIFRGTTKPHLFTWLGFGLLNAVSFFTQIAKGGGAGAWTSAVSAVCIFGIAMLAVKRGERGLTKFDWVCFGGTLAAIVLWLLTKEPLGAVIVITLADVLAFAPTYRKGYLRPNGETATLYVLSTLKYGLSLLALASFNLTTALFPAVVAVINAGFVLLLLVRRDQLKVLHN